MLTKIKKSLTREMKNTDDKEKILELKRRRDMVKQQIEEEEEVKEYTWINKIIEQRWRSTQQYLLESKRKNSIPR